MFFFYYYFSILTVILCFKISYSTICFPCIKTLFLLNADHCHGNRKGADARSEKMKLLVSKTRQTFDKFCQVRPES